jgi:hypothetical protein
MSEKHVNFGEGLEHIFSIKMDGKLYYNTGYNFGDEVVIKVIGEGSR